jgi:hypothetical protein
VLALGRGERRGAHAGHGACLFDRGELLDQRTAFTRVHPGLEGRERLARFSEQRT